MNPLFQTAKKAADVVVMNTQLNTHNENSNQYLQANPEVNDIFKNSGENEEDDEMVNVYCEKFKYFGYSAEKNQFWPDPNGQIQLKFDEKTFFYESCVEALELLKEEYEEWIAIFNELEQDVDNPHKDSDSLDDLDDADVSADFTKKLNLKSQPYFSEPSTAVMLNQFLQQKTLNSQQERNFQSLSKSTGKYSPDV